MSDALDHGISLALGESADTYDIEAIAEELRKAGAGESVDDVSAETFWDIVDRHPLPDSEDLSPLDRFKAEVTAAVGHTAPGQWTVWRRGGVTLEIRGHSRVNFTMPQYTATYRLTVVGQQTVWLTDDETSSWPRLWETVASSLEAWTCAVEERRQACEAADLAVEQARAALFAARMAADNARRELAALQPPGEDLVRHGIMTRTEVAEYLDIAPNSVRAQMAKWEIEAVEYRRGPNGRPEACYPTAAVQASAARRPGQGHRSDLT